MNKEKEKKMKKTPQDWYVEALSSILKEKRNYVGDFYKDEGYKYVLKAFADKYSNTFMQTDKKGNIKLFNMYWNAFKPGEYDKIYKSIIVSEEAYKYLLSDEITEISKADAARKLLKKNLHLEHLTPMGYSRMNLNCLESYDKNSVKNCFKYATVALITKEESKKLDKQARIKEADITCLLNLSKKYKEIGNDEINAVQGLFEQKALLKSNGSGLIRLIHLYNGNVNFVDCDGSVLELDALYKELINNRFELYQYSK